MPSDSNGVYSLPGGYLAVTGTTVQASQHNPPLEDIAAALTARLPRNGAAPMSGPLKLSDGTAAAPSMTFGSNAQRGLFKTADGIGFSVGGVQVAELKTGGFLPIGLGPLPWPTASAPSGWVLCDGAAVSRATYAALFAVIGTTYGPGNGSTTFNVPDMTGRAPVGLDALGTVLSGATVLGAALGAQTVTLTEAQLPAITPAGTIAIDEHGGHVHALPWISFSSNIGLGPTPVAEPVGSANSSSAETGITAVFTGTPFGSGQSHANVQPSLVSNFIMFAGI